MERREQLKQLIAVNSELVDNLIDELLYMESQLDYYRSLPQIKVDPERPERQKATPASKLYKETLQQYTNVVKVLAKCTGQDADDDESPLRQWARDFSELKKLRCGDYVNTK